MTRPRTLPALLLMFAAATHALRPPFDGAQLYRRHCSACHGQGGHGGVGVPLAPPSFLASVDDTYLRTTIRLGRPGRVMPAFAQLSAAEVAAIIHHVRSWPRPRPPAAHPRTPIAGDVQRGQTLFAKHCVTCHGAHGQGGHGTGVTFSRPRSAPILTPALNNSGFLAAASGTLIKTTLMHGCESTPLQSFLRQRLRERDINDIVAYVRSFDTLRTAGTAAPVSHEPPVPVRDSPYSLSETLKKVKTAVGVASQRLIRVQTLDQGFVLKGNEDPRQTIVYSCDFRFLNDALQADPRVGLFLPCRITLVQDGKKVQVMSVNPKRLARVFNNSELVRLCEQMHDNYISILEESVL